MTKGMQTRRHRSAPLRLFFALAVSASATLLGCAGDKAQSGGPSTGATPGVAQGNAKVTSLQVSPESLKVDKVGLRDGALHPDGSLDLAFVADVEGPVAALFLVATVE